MSAMKRSLPLWALLASTALLALPAGAAHATEGERSWRPATNHALEFEIIRGRLESFDGRALSLRCQHGEHAAWRLGFEVNADRHRRRLSHDGTSTVSGVTTVSQDGFQVTAQLTRLSFPWPERRLRPWFGLSLGGGTYRHAYENGQPTFTYSLVTGGPFAYGAALAGLEYAITPRFAVHAQYGQGLQYTGWREETALTYAGRGTSDGSFDGWQLYTTGARFGLAAFY